MYEDIKIENIMYLDIETQYLITEFEGGWKNPNNYKKIKIAELGTLQNNKFKSYREYNINNLIQELNETELIVGHNLINFDYKVLKHYLDGNMMFKILLKTFDTMIEFSKFTGDAGWVSLDDIAQRNFNMKKNEDSINIPKMWRNGRHSAVKTYLLNDLRMTEKFYLSGRKGYSFKYNYKYYGVSKGEREVFVKW